tara:strand:+ start:7987 stop:10968 length:2982 start_codon:yes stop_codon:yes gene_type:complete
MALTNKRGVFSLEDILDRQNSGNWIIAKEVWDLNAPVYFAAGATTSMGWTAQSTVNRIDYATDTATASPKGPIVAAVYHAAPATNQSYGFVIAGGPGKSGVQRYSYENDTSVQISGPSGASSLVVGLSNNEYGFFGTGNSSANLNKYDFSSNTYSSLGTKLTANHYSGNTLGTKDYGYWAGGNPVPAPADGSTVERFDYSDESANAVVKGPLARPSVRGSAAGNDNYGYVFGGYGHPSQPNAITGTSQTQRIDYSNDTATAVDKALLTGNMTWGGSTGGKTSAYVSRGGLTSVERFDFYNDTVATTPKGDLNSPSRMCTSLGSTKFAMYSSTRFTDDKLETNLSNSYAWNAGGGNYPSVPAYSNVERLDFSSDTTTASTRSNLPSTKKEGTRTSSGHSGYYVGGTAVPAGDSTSTFRIDYSNDTSPSDVANMLHTTRGDLSTGTENYGYYNATNDKTTVSRLDYSNNTVTVANPLSGACYRSDAVSSPSAGYYLRGYDIGAGTAFNSIIKYDFASETAVPSYTVQASSNTTSIYGRAAFFNKDYGYWAGGSTEPGGASYSKIDRLDFANDTVQGVTKGTLNTGVGEVPSSSTASDSYGYVFGGRRMSSPGNTVSLTQRIDFANDTATYNPVSNMSASKSWTMATAAPFVKNILISRFTDQSAYGTINGLGYPQPVQGFNWNPYGYVAGGQGPAYPDPGSTAFQRLDFSNDTNGFSVRTGGVSTGPATTRAQWGASSSAAFYKTAQPSPGSGTVTFDKVGTASDTIVQTGVGSFYLAGSYFGGGSTHNKSYAWFGGGWSSGVKHSDVSRLDFENDTGGTPARGYLSYARGEYMCAAGNQSYGYFGSGNAPDGWHSDYDRVDYSNDTATAPSRSYFLGASWQTPWADAATGNADYGYFTMKGYYTAAQRIDYSNDTAVAVAKATFDQFPGDASGGRTAMGNSDYGYWQGGGPYPASNSHNARITFSSDTTAATPKGNLVVPTQFATGSSQAQYGG